METLIDATDGQVELTFETFEEDAAKYGPYQHGVFQDGAFTIHQGRNDSLVELRLVNEEAEAAAGGPARTAARRKRRRVWGSATGEFRTSGRHGAATVRGTRWLTEERPAGTFFKVTEGVVLAEAFQRNQRRLLHAGESFLARPACVSRRNFRIRLRVPPGTTSPLGPRDGRRRAGEGLVRRPHHRAGRSARPAARHGDCPHPDRDGAGDGPQRRSHVSHMRRAPQL